MRLERNSGLAVFFMLMLWITGNGIHYIINVSAPNDVLVEQARRANKASEPQHNDTGLYAEALELMKTCSLNTEERTGNKFYTCPNGEKITQINWERNQGDRKGVVTRYFDAKGNLRLIYGHPDD
jgi:hypothetical protein